jgi:hypothetical protein
MSEDISQALSLITPGPIAIEDESTSAYSHSKNYGLTLTKHVTYIEHLPCRYPSVPAPTSSSFSSYLDLRHGRRVMKRYGEAEASDSETRSPVTVILHTGS